MLIYRRTSLLESTAQTLVNTVNCVGIMGKGIALEFKKREPEMFAAYKRICDQKLLAPGKLWLWRGEDHLTLNFPTKLHWRNPSKLEWIEAGLRKFVENYKALGIGEVSFPRLGCGNGGLDWDDVRPLMERYLSPLPIQVYIHDFTVDIGLPEHMEAVANKLRGERASDSNFESFMQSLYRATDLVRGNLLDISSKSPIDAFIIDGHLKLRFEEREWTFDREDLRGVWVGLQKGLLTKEKAGWTSMEGGGPLLSLISLLPHVRPIQIQKAECQAELAVELLPTLGADEAIPESKKQIEMAWR
ncbi:macro domain-containing protein [Bradyrhizobium sp. WSM471]|uniref:macro domain-containing protein n=1 Tax=Bradyrhizobium sp. WSM471 TaxID=319017 RepID=UPI00024D2D0B|nr:MULTISPECIES: macro domain-containing protein [Bradyrhizobium]EHR03769.1 putative phosphatase, C-terminal domain of histone macro H2A1 like protein [Bradyrhizobium sp. WSM471]UFW38954.1 macro domain-containing protein [Bradyrhizobium canariense]